MVDAKQKSLEETSKVALDAADAAARAAEEIHNVKKEYEKFLNSNRSILKNLSIALISTAIGLVLAIGLSSLVYFKSRAQFEKSDEMLLQAVAVFAENVDDLTLAQNNLNSLIENQNDLKNEFGLTRKSLDTVPNRVDEKLDTLVPLVKQVVEARAEQLASDISTLTETSNAVLTEQLVSMSEKLTQLSVSLVAIQARMEDTENSEKTQSASSDASYALTNVKSDLEQIVLLQKELSAKITLLQDLNKPKPAVQKTRNNSTKSSNSNSSNPLKFP